MALGMGATASQAATSYSSVGSFGTGEIDCCSVHGHLAVDDASGQVMVADTDRVKVYASSGGGVPAYLTDFGAGVLGMPAGVAIDQDSGAIYVGDPSNGRIVKFLSDHAETPTFTLDLTYLGPSAADVGDFSSALAVDPRNGNLLVADRAARQVKRFDSIGTPIGTPFDGVGSEQGAFQTLESIAVDAAGDVYVVDVRRDFLPLETLDTTALVKRLNESGVAKGTLEPRDNDKKPHSVAFDSKSGNIVVGGRTPQSGSDPVPVMYVFNDGAFVTSFAYPAEVGVGTPVAVAVDGGASGRLYGLTRFGNGGLVAVQAFDPIVLPEVVVAPATDVMETEVTLHGTINPVGLPNTGYRFEYSDDDGQTWESTDTTAVTGDTGPFPSAPEPATATVTGLEPNQAYLARLVGENANGTIDTSTVAFTTLVAAPSVTTERALDKTVSSATLRGTINPHGLQATYYFEYGTTTDYGSRMPVGHDGVVGNGHVAKRFQAGISNLQAGTEYHFRLVATNSAGTTFGPDSTFTTAASPDGRRYELVSPLDKGGSNVDIRAGFYSSPDGDRLAYRWRTPPAGSSAAQGASAWSWTAATRDAESWRTVGLDPPSLPASPEDRGTNGASTLATSPDNTKALVATRKKLADGASEGDSNLYIRDIATGAYTTILSVPGANFDVQAHGLQSNPYIDATSDFGRVLIGGMQLSLLPGIPGGAMYEWTGDQLRVASVAPDGAPMGDVRAGLTAAVTTRENRYISDDGSRVVWPTNSGGVYVRIDGQTTLAVSGSHRTGDPPGTVGNATYAGFTRNGRYAFIFASDLTDDSTPGEVYLYRFDVDANELEIMTPVGYNSSFLQTSGQGESVFFTSTLNLAPGATVDAKNVYVLHDGDVQHVATVDGALDGMGGLAEWLASPNGEYLAFAAYTSLTGFDNSSRTACLEFNLSDPMLNFPAGTACREIYRYDVDADELTCASCRPDGGPVLGGAHIGPYAADLGVVHFPRSILDDGTVFFDTSDPLVAADSNSGRDVYSFDGDQAALISAGRGAGNSHFNEATPDGRSVFFSTQDKLVGADVDNAFDVYAARVGGGLAGQSPEPRRGACFGEDCRSAGAGPETSPTAPTQTLGEARKAPSSGRPRVSVSSAAFQGSILRIAVRVSGAGRIRVSGSKVAGVSKATRKAGVYRLRVRLTKRQQKLRRSGSRVRASLKVTFKPSSGKAVSVKLTRTAR